MVHPSVFALQSSILQLRHANMLQWYAIPKCESGLAHQDHCSNSNLPLARHALLAVMRL